MPSSAPSAFMRAILSSDDEVTMTRAPFIFAHCMAKTETPPVPVVTSV